MKYFSKFATGKRGMRSIRRAVKDRCRRFRGSAVSLVIQSPTLDAAQLPSPKVPLGKLPRKP